MSNNTVNLLPTSGEDSEKNERCSNCRMLGKMHPVMIVPNITHAHYVRDAGPILNGYHGTPVIAATGDPVESDFGIYFICEKLVSSSVTN